MVKKILSELIGTAILSFVICATIVNVQASAVNLTGIIITAAMYIGLMIVLIKLFGKTSGGHFNPSVSLAMLLDGKISVVEFLCYLIAQMVGAAVGVVLLKFMFPYSDSLGAPSIYDGDLIKTVIVESFACMIITLVYLKEANDIDGKEYGIGIAYSVAYLFSAPLDGAGLNIARVFAAMIFSSFSMIADTVAFVIGPVLGSLIAFLIYKLLLCSDEELNETIETNEIEKTTKRKNKKKNSEVAETDDKETEKGKIEQYDSENVEESEPSSDYEESNQFNFEKNEDDAEEQYGYHDYSNDEEPEDAYSQLLNQKPDAPNYPVPVDDTVYEDEAGNRYYLYTDGNYYPIQ